MAEGGFLIRIDGKEIGRGYAVAVDYDEWTYTVNSEAMPLPPKTKKIEIVVEER